MPAIQKFWRGSQLPAPEKEASFFAALNLEALTITFSDDSRVAAFVEQSALLPITGANVDAIQLAVAADVWQSDDSFQINAGDGELCYRGIAPNRWLDIRIPLVQASRELHIKTSAPLHVSYPRTVRTKFNKDNVARHILVIVLDGMTPFLEVAYSQALPSCAVAPNIERFFSRGFVAKNCYSTGEWTLPTTASFFTGLYSSRHGVYHPTLPMIMPQRPLLAEIIQNAGFHTLALSTANRLTPAYGSNRGFDRFIYHWPYSGYTSLDYDPARWCDEITGHLDVHRHDNTFIYAHFPDTHPPWDIPPLTRSFNLSRMADAAGHDLAAIKSSKEAGALGPYLNMLRLHELDRLLGGVFDFIDRELGEETIVVLTADHGTPWEKLRNSRPSDEPYLVDQRTRISFRMRGPGVPAKINEDICSPNIDLMPTILSRLGLSYASDVDGFDLLNIENKRDWVISESLYDGMYEVAVRDGKHIYIEKYPMSDKPIRLTGPAFYRKLFHAGECNYGLSIDENHSIYASIVLSHLKRVGLI